MWAFLRQLFLDKDSKKPTASFAIDFLEWPIDVGGTVFMYRRPILTAIKGMQATLNKGTMLYRRRMPEDDIIHKPTPCRTFKSFMMK